MSQHRQCCIFSFPVMSDRDREHSDHPADSTFSLEHLRGTAELSWTFKLANSVLSISIDRQ